jgi:hypothetical protein
MLVSILIPFFNAEKWVAQAIESALAQTWPEKDNTKLSPARRQAVNDARYQIARETWQRDRKLALSVAQQIKYSDPSFCPSKGNASSQSYRLVYRMLGFRGAQWVADSRRSVASIVSDCAM